MFILNSGTYEHIRRLMTDRLRFDSVGTSTLWITAQGLTDQVAGIACEH